MRFHGGVPPIHDSLVARLVADALPVRRLWPPALRLAGWLILAVAAVATAMGIGLREDLAAPLRRPLYVLEVAALLGAAGAAAAAALLAAVPGRGVRRGVRVALVLGAIAAAALLAEPTPAVGPSLAGLRCAFCIAMFGLLPWIALFTAVGRGAPLDGRAAGAYVGGAAFLVGAAAVRIACPVDDPLHVLGWHMLPILPWSALSAVAGAAWLTRWRRATSA
jgi:hypothetical protein